MLTADEKQELAVKLQEMSDEDIMGLADKITMKVLSNNSYSVGVEGQKECESDLCFIVCVSEWLLSLVKAQGELIEQFKVARETKVGGENGTPPVAPLLYLPNNTLAH